MKNALLLGLGLYLLLIGNTAFAIKVVSLYMGEVRVNSQSPEERHKATQAALAQVFIKVSGNLQILSNPGVKQHLNKASALMQQFGYTTPTDSHQDKPYLLQIHFDINGVNQCLRDANVPIWGQNRPLILGWIHDESTEPATILSLNTANPTTDLMKQAMEQRGIPFTFPVMDTIDANLINPNDIMTKDAPKLLTAAKRYNSNAMLIGRVSKNADMFTTQWTLTMGKDQWGWTITGKSLNNIIPALIDTITTTLSTRFAVVTSNNIQKNIALKITGIDQQSDFARLIRYLSHLTPVVSVSISSIDGSNVLLNINLRSTEESFLKAVSLGKRLSAATQDVKTSPMIFQWNP